MSWFQYFTDDYFGHMVPLISEQELNRISIKLIDRSIVALRLNKVDRIFIEFSMILTGY